MLHFDRSLGAARVLHCVFVGRLGRTLQGHGGKAVSRGQHQGVGSTTTVALQPCRAATVHYGFWQ